MSQNSNVCIVSKYRELSINDKPCRLSRYEDYVCIQVSTMSLDNPLTKRAIASEPLNSALSPFIKSVDSKSIDSICLNFMLGADFIQKHMGVDHDYCFVCQSRLEDDIRYYEQIIFEDHSIPTRANSWHDFFNALIWSKYPQSKQYCNQLHIDEIEQGGLHPRTKIRNNITLFDECGIIVLTSCSSVKRYFEQQDWLALFCSESSKPNSSHQAPIWFENTFPFIFGHAIYEMMLQPFIGLTAKALVLEVDAVTLKSLQNEHSRDKFLREYLKNENIFSHKKPFFPLPVLGIPGWHLAAQDREFYSNTQYFMPKRKIE